MRKTPVKDTSDMDTLKMVASMGKDYGEQVLWSSGAFRKRVLDETGSPFAATNSTVQGLSIGLAEAVSYAIKEDDKELQEKVYADVAVFVRDLLIKHSGEKGMTIMIDI